MPSAEIDWESLRWLRHWALLWPYIPPMAFITKGMHHSPREPRTSPVLYCQVAPFSLTIREMNPCIMMSWLLGVFTCRFILLGFFWSSPPLQTPPPPARAACCANLNPPKTRHASSVVIKLSVTTSMPSHVNPAKLSSGEMPSKWVMWLPFRLGIGICIIWPEKIIH